MISIIVIVVALVFLALFLKSYLSKPSEKKVLIEQKVQQIVKPNYGHMQIFYGSQTGTAAKMAEGFAQQATQKGFEPQVVDLKDITFDHLDIKGDISIFFMSNTGQGQAPDNCVKFMKVLKQKQDLHQQKVIDWSKVAFTVFGLGNTQYEFYNKIGIDCDSLLQKRGANRIYQLGLGDNNASLEDDYVQWKNELWAALIEYRLQNPLARKVERKQSITLNQKVAMENIPSSRQYLSKQLPIMAHYRFFICEKYALKFPYTEEDLDFKTKASLKSQQSKVSNIHETRQNTKDGSTLQLTVEFQGQPEYETAGNLALYPKNDAGIVKQIIEYFNLSQQQLKSHVSIERIQEKKLKLNFIPFLTLEELLYEHIDVQGRITKSILKKLSKLESLNQEYFASNASPKTTAEFKRITENTVKAQDWYYLFRLIKQYKVKIVFEDFIDLCDSIAPRLFTIASSYKKQKGVVVSASMVENGLISKYFLENPKNIRAEFRKSTFTDAMQWDKVIFISAGTGFAPFRGFLQEKEILVQRSKNGQNVKLPNITLLFGCRHQQGDFIYKQEINKWRQTKVIEKFEGAFSRDSEKKVYVQHLLEKNNDLIKQFMTNQNFAIYICGSLGMGHDVSQVLAKQIGGHQKVKQLETKGRIVKELW